MPWTSQSTTFGAFTRKRRARMLAVHMVCECNDGVQETADRLMQCPDWVSKWVQRYREGGIDAFWDLPRTGRLPCIGRDGLDQIMKEEEAGLTAAQDT